MNKIFDEIEDLVLYYATDDYDYKKSVALFNVGKIEKMVDYCRYLQHQLEEKGKENQQLKKQKDELEKENNELQKAYELIDKSMYELMKQKDDVVEYIKEHKHLNWYVESCYTDNLLRMLGEIDENR